MSRVGFVAYIRQFLNTAKWGVLSLCAVNISAAFTGVSLGFGWVSGCVAVVLGPVGVVGLLVIHAIFSIA